MKHLKIRGELSKDMNTAVVSVIEQTHRLSKFGRQSDSSYVLGVGSESFLHDGVRLLSRGGPAYGGVSMLGPGLRIFLRGSIIGVDNKEFTIPAEHWPKIKAAVSAYNEWGANQ